MPSQQDGKKRQGHRHDQKSQAAPIKWLCQQVAEVDRQRETQPIDDQGPDDGEGVRHVSRLLRFLMLSCKVRPVIVGSRQLWGVDIQRHTKAQYTHKTI